MHTKLQTVKTTKCYGIREITRISDIKKKKLLKTSISASGTFVMAQIPYKLSPSFSVEMLSCLLGAMFVSAAFCGDYLYTMELAPTSHRGKMLGYCSFAARIGRTRIGILLSAIVIVFKIRNSIIFIAWGPQALLLKRSERNVERSRAARQHIQESCLEVMLDFSFYLKSSSKTG